MFARTSFRMQKLNKMSNEIGCIGQKCKKNSNNNKRKKIEWHAVGWMKNSSLVITKFVLVTWCSIKIIFLFLWWYCWCNKCDYLVKNKRKNIHNWSSLEWHTSCFCILSCLNQTDYKFTKMLFFSSFYCMRFLRSQYQEFLLFDFNIVISKWDNLGFLGITIMDYSN